MNDSVIYEFPLSERMRLFMRLEQLFQQLDHFLGGSTIWDTRAVIDILVDLQTIFSRNDVKSEILKELDRHSHVLSRISESEAIDSDKLDAIMDQLDEISRQLYSCSGKIGLSLMENDFFKSICQRSVIPGGTCAFDLPDYYYWLNKDEGERRRDLEEWLHPFDMVRTAIKLILSFIRQSSLPTEETAPAGFYQETLDKSLPYQLLRVGIARQLPYFSEISGGKHRFTVRFMALAGTTRAVQTSEDVPFMLTRCLF